MSRLGPDEVHSPEWELSPCQTKDLLAREPERWVLIDCRRPDEHALARIDGALLVPLDQLASRLPELEAHADDRRLIIYCHHGRRSMQAAAFLREQGFEGAMSMSGGIERWAADVDPGVPRY